VCPLTYITTDELVNDTLTANQSPWNIWEEQIAFQLSHLYFTSRIEILKPKTSKLSQSRNLRPQLLHKRGTLKNEKMNVQTQHHLKNFLPSVVAVAATVPNPSPLYLPRILNLELSLSHVHASLLKNMLKCTANTQSDERPKV
jgi:hypothetical protein